MGQSVDNSLARIWITYIKVKIKAIDAMLPNDDYFLRWERLSKRGKVAEGDYMESTII